MNDSNRIAEMEEKNRSLEEEMKYLQEDLSAADEEVEQLEKKIQTLENSKSIFLDDIQVISEMKEILNAAVHTVSICTPTIEDLDKLELYSLSSSVVLKVSCEIDPLKPQHLRIKDELMSFDNITLREYSGRDRWSILKDREILFMAIIGEKPNHLLSVKTNDPAQIQVFNTLITETWLRSQKI